MVLYPAAMLSETTIPGEGTVGVCPSLESRDAAIQNITATIQTMLRGFTTSQNCGVGLWYQVAYSI